MSFKGVTILLSYAYAKPKVLGLVEAAAQRGADVIIDSGAFTAWRSGKAIDLEAYAAFLRNLPFKPLFAVTLDVIGDPEATHRNTARLRALGVDVTPVVTRGASEDEIVRACDYDGVVALGGLVGTPRNNGYVKHLMDKHGDTKWHWLGFANAALIARYRPFSCDVSTWHASLRRGATCMVYVGKGKLKAIQPYAFAKAPTAQVSAMVRSFGFAPREFSHFEAWRGGQSRALVLSAQSYLRYSRDMCAAYGTRIAFATISADQMAVLHEAVEREASLVSR